MCAPHAIWRTIRRPFRSPSCLSCTWETYDFDRAGCLKCGAAHHCAANAVDSTCPLVTNDDLSRVCPITGFVLSEVRHAKDEFIDTGTTADAPAPILASLTLLDTEVQHILHLLLRSERAQRYRAEENDRQSRKLAHGLTRKLKQCKALGLAGLPNVCSAVADVVHTERSLRFVRPASTQLIGHCARQILLCLVDLRAKGVRLAQGARLRNLICGTVYLLRTGLTYQNHVLITAVEEIGECLPFENKLEAYFGFSSKVICETENEIKLVFRSHYQRAGA